MRPKYRDSLKRWFSELGGGSGNIWDFQDYCGNERWLAWVYMIDAASGFLLCSNASPVCPDILCNESGFYKGGKSSVGTNSPNQLKKDILTNAILKAEKSSEALQDTAKILTQFIELKKTALTMPVVRPIKKPRTSVLETMDEVQRLANHSSKIDEGGYGFSPNTKAKLLDSIKAEQKKKVQMALNFPPSDSSSDNNSN